MEESWARFADRRCSECPNYSPEKELPICSVESSPEGTLLYTPRGRS